jgi:hypothetical protein
MPRYSVPGAARVPWRDKCGGGTGGCAIAAGGGTGCGGAPGGGKE